MKRKFVLTGLILTFVLVVSLEAAAAEKLKYGSSIRVVAWFYLPVLAGEEAGIWRANGLDVEWVPFSTGAAHFSAIASGAISVGTMLGIDLIQTTSRGIPIVAVAQPFTGQNKFKVWVRTDSRIKKVEDLPGAKLGVSRPGAAEHAYGRISLKALGLEGKVRFVGTGGILESLAALRAGAIDGVMLSIFQMTELKVKGQVRDIFSVDDHLPQDWVPVVVYARKDFISAREETVARLVKAISQAADFILKNPAWAMEKMKQINNYSDPTARILYGEVSATSDVRINKKGLENVRNFAMEYDLVSKERTPPAEELYTARFAP